MKNFYITTGNRHGLLLIILLIFTNPIDSLSQSQDSLRQVRIGLYLTDLVEISGSKQSFLADVIMIASWEDPTLVGSLKKTSTVDINKVWHPQLLIVNQRDVKKSLPESATVDPDGSVRYIQRFTGTFSAVLNLRSFPLDSQSLNIWVVAPMQIGENVQLIVDNSMSTLQNDHLSISDWRVDTAQLAPREFHATANTIPAPGIELSMMVHRLPAYYIIQVIIPLLAIMFMAWAVFWIAPPTTNVRISVGITTMLTLIAYRFALANHVPRLSYLTRLDWFLLGATLLVLLVLGIMAFSAYLVRTGREEQVERIDYFGRFIYPSIVVIFTLVVWLL